MKLKNNYVTVRMIASLCLIMTVFMSSSMVALATSVKPIGELIISNNSNASDKTVTVNGEPAVSGRTIFAASTIATPEGMTAILDLGKAGKIELAPNTTFKLNADGGLDGDLSAGNAKVLNSAKSVNIKTLTGDVLNLNAGDIASANSSTVKTHAAAANDLDWWAWVLIFGAATAVILWITLHNNNNGTQTSPVR